MKGDTLTETEWKQKMYTQLSSSEQGRHIVCETDQTDHHSSVMTWKHSLCSPLALSLSCNPSSAISVLSIIFPSFIPLTGSNLYHEIGRKIRANMHTIQNITGVGVRYKTWHSLSESIKLFHLQVNQQQQKANFLHLLRKLQNGQPTYLRSTEENEVLMDSVRSETIWKYTPWISLWISLTEQTVHKNVLVIIWHKHIYWAAFQVHTDWKPGSRGKMWYEI